VTTSRFGAVVDALVTLVDATSVAHTFDGPPNTADTLAEYAIVGGTDDPDDDAGEIDQTWAGIGAGAKQETGEVVCAVLVGTGDDVVKTARDRALVLFGEVETALRADKTLGGVITSGWCEMASGKPRQRRNTNGLYVRIEFTVRYQTRI
jgi:hypothetical protein